MTKDAVQHSRWTFYEAVNFGEGEMVSDLKRVIDQVSREKGLDREVLVKTLEEAVKAHSIESNAKRCEIKVSKLGNSAGSMGAAMLTLQEYFTYENIKLWPCST